MSRLTAAAILHNQMLRKLENYYIEHFSAWLDTDVAVELQNVFNGTQQR